MKNLAEGNISQKFRLKNIDETRNYFLILGSATTGCASMSTFASLVGISIGITSSAIGLKICPIIAAIKKHQSIIKKKKNKRSKKIL